MLNSLLALAHMVRYPMSLCFIETPNEAGGGTTGGNPGGNTPPATPPAGTDGDGSTQAPPGGSGDDWEAKYKAEQKAKRDLEKKYKGVMTKDEADSLRAEIAKLQGKEKEFEAAQKVRDAEAAALTKANERVVARAVREHAATLLASPEDALKFIDLTQFEVDEDGDVDDAAIKAAVEELAKNKPYLATGGDGFVPVTAGREGALNANQPKQLTLKDLDAMTSAQIHAAAKAGQLKDLGF